MGCFFTCFRIRDDDRRRCPALDSTPRSALRRRRDDLVSKNRLASLFLSEEEDSLGESNSRHDSIEKGLQQEVKLLKACGAISETPVELRKALKKINAQAKLEDESLMILGSSCKRLDWDENHQTPGFSPLEDRTDASAEERRDVSAGNSGRSASEIRQLEIKNNISLASLLSGQQNIDHSCAEGSVLPEDAKVNHPLDCNLKSSALNISTPQDGDNLMIDFKTESVSKFSSLSMVIPGDNIEGKFPGCCLSPFPTPLNLSDEMQTPGTVYPSNLHFAPGRKELARSQYVYPVLDHLKVASQPKAARENGELIKFSASQDQNGEIEIEHSSEIPMPDSNNTNNQVLPVENPQYSSPASHIKSENFETHPQGSRKWMAVKNGIPVVESLSQWLKPPDTGNEMRKDVFKKEISDIDRDRPIIGTVAAHWNEEDSSHISPKWWDGNGIPNSTNKYKEDQKVSWHATPFEERLEKALSEDNLYPDRKLKAEAINFNVEDEESDTAAS